MTYIVNQAAIDAATPMLVGYVERPEHHLGHVVLSNLTETDLTADEARTLSVRWSNVAHFIETGRVGAVHDELLV